MQAKITNFSKRNRMFSRARILVTRQINVRVGKPSHERFVVSRPRISRSRRKKRFKRRNVRFWNGVRRRSPIISGVRRDRMRPLRRSRSRRRIMISMTRRRSVYRRSTSGKVSRKGNTTRKRSDGWSGRSCGRVRPRILPRNAG